MSREHLWPEWARCALEADSGRPAPLVPHVIAWSDGHARGWKAPIFSATLKDVCRVCNNGWMSDIEELSKEFVLPMLRDEEVSLGKAGSLRCISTSTTGGFSWGVCLVRPRYSASSGC
jgi:hypothetical protein